MLVAALSAIISVVVIDHLRPLSAPEPAKALPIARGMAKAVHQRLHALERQRTGRNARSCLQRTLQKPAAARPQRSSVLRVRDRRARLIGRNLRPALLRRRRRRRRGGSIVPPQQIPQKTRSVLRLRMLLHLLHLLHLRLQRCQLRLRLIQRILLHQNSLRENVQRIRITSQSLLQHLLCVHVLLCKLCLLHAVDQAADHVLFLGCHLSSLSLSASHSSRSP